MMKIGGGEGGEKYGGVRMSTNNPRSNCRSLLDRRVSVKEKSQGRHNKQLVRYDDDRETKTRERNKN